MKKRSLAIDLAKFIAIYLVVFRHTLISLTPGADTLSIGILAYCMPVFFAVSGYFLHREIMRGNSLKVLFRKKALRLLIPYFMWSFVSFGFHVAIIFASRSENWTHQVLREAIDIFIYGRSLWFLLILFFASIVMPVLYRASNRWKINFLLLTSLCYIMAVLFLPNDLFSLYKFKWAFPFLLFGFYYAKYEDKMVKLKAAFLKIGWTTYILLPLFVAFVLRGGVVESPFKISVFSLSLQSLDLCVRHMIASFLGMGAIFFLAHKLSVLRVGEWLSKYGQYTLDVYVIHMPLISFAGVIPGLLDGIRSHVLFELALDVVCLLFAACVVAGILLARSYVLRRFRLYNFSVGRVHTDA